MSDLPVDRMIPILPCRSIDDQLEFYESLGFEVTYRQSTTPWPTSRMRRDVLLVQARILRAEAAHALGDDTLAALLLGEAAKVVLGGDGRAELADDLARADELRLTLA